MVAQCNQIDAVLKQLGIYLRRNAGAARSVFGIGNDTVNLQLFNQRFELISQDTSAGPTYYISYTQNIYLHRRISYSVFRMSYVAFSRPL